MPNTPDYHSEPALSIGEVFAKKPLIQPVIAAAVAIIAGAFNVVVGDGVVDNITTIVMFAAMIWAAIGANQEKSKLVTEQAEETREAVYSPSTTERLVKIAAETSNPIIPPPPASSMKSKGDALRRSDVTNRRKQEL